MAPIRTPPLSKTRGRNQRKQIEDRESTEARSRSRSNLRKQWATGERAGEDALLEECSEVLQRQNNKNARGPTDNNNNKRKEKEKSVLRSPVFIPSQKYRSTGDTSEDALDRSITLDSQDDLPTPSDQTAASDIEEETDEILNGIVAPSQDPGRDPEILFNNEASAAPSEEMESQPFYPPSNQQAFAFDNTSGENVSDPSSAEANGGDTFPTSPRRQAESGFVLSKNILSAVLDEKLDRFATKTDIDKAVEQVRNNTASILSLIHI